jgi:hypothetical protein
VELQGEYKKFVNKCKALDPSAAFYTPGEAHGYIGKRKMEEIMEKQAQGEYDRASKRAKYDHPNTVIEKSDEGDATEYSTEDLFNPDGTFKELHGDVFIASMDAEEEEIATPLAYLPNSATTQVNNNQFDATASSARDQDQPLYNFPKVSVRNVTDITTDIHIGTQVRAALEPKDEPAEGLSLLANYNSSSDEDD